MSGLGLADLFDLEIRTLEEKRENEEARRTRYRNLGRRVLEQGAAPSDSGALLKALLRLDPQPRTAGARFEAALRGFHALLALAGILLGASVSLGLLHYAGEHPVNILNALAALVGVQLVLLLLLLLALIPRRPSSTPGPFQGFLRMLFRKVLARSLHDAAPERLRILEDRLDAHRGLLRWLLVRAAQVFGVAFNLAALAGCLYRITFSDVAFGWSTTLHFDATTFHALAKALSAPWAWMFPHAVPSLQLVELTQYSHLEGKYLLRAAGERSADPAIVGGWWSFLLLSLGTYGLLPRLVVLAFSAIRVRRILEETPAQNEEFRRLCDWMRLPLIMTLAPKPETTDQALPVYRPEEETPLPPQGMSCEVVIDGLPIISREALEKMVRDRFGWTVSDVHPPGHTDRQSGDAPLLMLISAWEEPTKGNWRRFQGIPKSRLIILGLLDPASSSNHDPRLENILQRWKSYLQNEHADLRLRVEPLEMRP